MGAQSGDSRRNGGGAEELRVGRGGPPGESSAEGQEARLMVQARSASDSPEGGGEASLGRWVSGGHRGRASQERDL